MKPLNYLASLMLGLLLYNQNTLGQEKKIDSVSTVYLQPVTVIAVKSPILSATKTISPIQRLSHDAGQILNELTAFNSIRKSGNYGFDPVFRGFKFDQINVVIDGGLSATAACPSRMDPPTSQIAPNMTSKIEVFKGPYALRYGTGFGATLNIVTLEPQRNPELLFSGRISSSYQTNGDLFGSEAQFGYKDKSSSLQGFASVTEGEDYTSGDGTLIAAHLSRKSLGLDYSIDLGRSQQIDAEITYNQAKNVEFPAQTMDLLSDQTLLVQLKHQISFTGSESLKRWSTSIFGSTVDHLMGNTLREGPKMADALTDASTENYGARSELFFNFSSAQLFLGADFRVDSASGYRSRTFLMGPNKGRSVLDNVWQGGQIQKAGVFSEYRTRLGELSVVGAARIEHNHSFMSQPDELFTSVNQFDPNQVNFNLSLGLKKQLNPQSTLGLWLGRASRSGSLSERFINFLPIGIDPYELVGNPNLKAEKNYQADLIFETHGDNTHLSINLFGSYLEDFISSQIDANLSPRMATAPGVRRFVNIPKAFKTGVEGSFDHSISKHLYGQVSIAYTYAHNQTNGEPLPEIAPIDFRYALRGSFNENKLVPSLSFRKVGEQNRVATSFGEVNTPGFEVLDAAIEYHISNAVTLQAEVTNIFNENYYEHLSRAVSASVSPLFSPGRNLSTRLIFSF